MSSNNDCRKAFPLRRPRLHVDCGVVILSTGHRADLISRVQQIPDFTAATLIDKTICFSIQQFTPHWPETSNLWGEGSVICIVAQLCEQGFLSAASSLPEPRVRTACGTRFGCHGMSRDLVAVTSAVRLADPSKRAAPCSQWLQGTSLST
jgi:hypothetical protein